MIRITAKAKSTEGMKPSLDEFFVEEKIACKKWTKKAYQCSQSSTRRGSQRNVPVDGGMEANILVLVCNTDQPTSR